MRRWPLVVVGLAVAVTAGTLWQSTRRHLPALRDTSGGVITGSISEEFYHIFNGRREWLTIRGVDPRKPVVIKLHGGPGSADLGQYLGTPSVLETHATIVDWHRPCAGRSYHFFETCRGLTYDIMLEDLDGLVDYLSERFDKEKLFLLGHSWGSVVALLYAHQKPAKIAAVITIGQATAVREMSAWNFDYALTAARERNHALAHRELKSAGPPVFEPGPDGDYDFWDATPQLFVHRQWVAEFRGSPPDQQADPAGLGRAGALTHVSRLDRYRLRLGQRRSLAVLGDDILAMDIEDLVPSLEMPVYFLLGRLDPVNPPELAKDYLVTLRAPSKRIIWYERSGHAPHRGSERAQVERDIVELIHATPEPSRVRDGGDE